MILLKYHRKYTYFPCNFEIMNTETHNRKIFLKADELHRMGHALLVDEVLDARYGVSYRSLSLRQHIAFDLRTDCAQLNNAIKQIIENTQTERKTQLAYIQSLIKNLLSYCRGLEYDKAPDIDYVRLVKRETLLFRRMYRQWVRHLTQ